MSISDDAAQRRENARHTDSGRFGEHAHSDPEIDLSEDGYPLEWEPTPPVYDMPASQLAEAVKRIERANRRLERAGVEERFTYEVEHYIHVPENDVVGVSAVHLTLNTPVIRQAGWAFAGAHELTADGHIVNYGSARVDEMRCDHCGHARRRGKVYSVVNNEGEQKVVGSNCLGAFLGIRPEGLWAMTFDLEDAPDGEDDEEARWSASTGDVTVEAVDLIGAALAASHDGEHFVPKSKATFQDPPTAQRVAENLRSLVKEGQEPERRANAERILAWVNEQPDGGSDYIDNLRAVLAGKERWVARKHFGIGASAIAAHRNALAWAARDALKKEENDRLYEPGHVGQVGERLRDRPMTVTASHAPIEGDYGYSTRLTFRDDETGAQVTWNASGWRSFDVGQKLVVTGTVKEHGEFRGTDQTVLTRGKLKSPEGE